MAPICLAIISVCGINRIPSCSEVLPPMATNPNDWSDTFRAFRVAPSSLLEITVKESVGAILNKKPWWLNPVSRWLVGTLEPALTAAAKKTDARVIPQAVDFVRAVLEKGATRETVKETLANVEARPYTLKLLYNDIKKKLIEVQEVITRTIDQLASSDDLQAQFVSAENGVDTAVLSPTGIHGSWITGDFIPVAVKSTFLNQVAMLENVPDNLKDWHPDTNKQVLNLIHQSLHCVVVKWTKRISEPLILEPNEISVDHMKQLMFSANTGTMLYKFSLKYRSPFQWILSDFEIRDDGNVRIASYINNLHPVQHADMYTSIETIFSRFVPRFEHTLASLKIPFPTEEFIVPDYHLLGKQCPVVWDSLRLPHAPHVSLRGKTVQVIVEMAEILLVPESPRYKGARGTLRFTVTKLGLNEDAQRTIHDFSRGAAMTLEEAQQYRIKLMEERSGSSKPDPDDYASYFNLSEH